MRAGSHGYQIVKSDKDANLTEVDFTDYLRDLFASTCGACLLSGSLQTPVLAQLAAAID
jgi:hypothetical protein